MPNRASNTEISKLTVCIVGCGKRGREYLDVLRSHQLLTLVAICDRDETKLKTLVEQSVSGVRLISNLDDLLQSVKTDVAIVCLSDKNDQFAAVCGLIERGIHVIQEKPLAATLQTAAVVCEKAKAFNVKVMVAAQRKFFPCYDWCKTLTEEQRLGTLISLNARYTLNTNGSDKGCAAENGAGVFLDLGYRITDLILWLVGQPDNVTAIASNKNQDDTVSFLFEKELTFGSARNQLVGNVFLSRNYFEPKEELSISGDKGCLVIRKNSVALYDANSVLRETRTSHASKVEILDKMLTHFVNAVPNKETLRNSCFEHLQRLTFIEKIRQSLITKRTIAFDDVIEAPSSEGHYIWPVITKEARQAVLKQLDDSVSISDRSGIIKEFEDAFASYHQRKFALLSNSGANAILSMYQGVGIQPGDEVIAPVYTFSATASPLVHFGAKVIFCDCRLDDGNIDPDEILNSISCKTKAVIVTHAWGMPCNDMDRIAEICKTNNLKLLEDCSHAHGAEYKGRKVGTFGDAAAWSLEGRSVVAGGEVGVMLTDNREIYVLAQLHGHYGERCQREILRSHPFYKFARTGFGQRFAAHPLAVALAMQQFGHLDEWLDQKRRFASCMMEKLGDIPFLKMPQFDTETVKPAWHAFVVRFDSTKTDVSLDDFCRALSEEGLSEIEKSPSTGPVNHLPLFTEAGEIFPWFYSVNEMPNVSPKRNYSNAKSFYKNALKLPVWAFSSDKEKVDKYVNGILKVVQNIKDGMLVAKGHLLL